MRVSNQRAALWVRQSGNYLPAAIIVFMSATTYESGECWVEYTHECMMSMTWAWCRSHTMLAIKLRPRLSAVGLFGNYHGSLRWSDSCLRPDLGPRWHEGLNNQLWSLPEENKGYDKRLWWYVHISPVVLWRRLPVHQSLAHYGKHPRVWHSFSYSEEMCEGPYSP